MEDLEQKKILPTELLEEKAGYLVIRLKPGEGVFVNGTVEIRISCIRASNEVQLAIRAPKNLPIRRLR